MAAPQMHPRYLILPGLSNSGPDHWQSLWEAADSAFERVQQHEWDKPDAGEWQRTLEAKLAESPRPTVLIAHSLACTLVVRWAAAHLADPSPVVAALLVAPADVESELHTPPETRCFAPFPMVTLPFATEVIAGRDDPYVSFERARLLAERWGAAFSDAGDFGHLNSSSGLGDWPFGFQRLAALISKAGLAARS
jgi:uncharacterized protein